MLERVSVLIVDDDPVHLKIYGWIIEAAGYRAVPVQVQFKGVQLSEDRVDLVLLGLHFAGLTTAIETAKLIKARYPHAPIVVLSEAVTLPDDIAPLVQGFVRKGDPAKLVDSLHQLLASTP